MCPLQTSVRQILDDIVALGLNVVRTWAFSDGPSALHTGPHKPLNEQVAAGLDYVVQQARARRLRLILPLLGYWDDFGGLGIEQRWCLDALDDASAASPRGWSPLGQVRFLPIPSDSFRFLPIPSDSFRFLPIPSAAGAPLARSARASTRRRHAGRSTCGRRPP